jgi:hypothetical protein
VDVAEAAAPAARDHDLLVGRDEIAEQLSGGVLIDRRPGRYREDQVVTGPAVALRARASPAGDRPEVVGVAEVAEGRLAGVDPQIDRATPAAVAAVGAAARDVGLAPECRGAVSAVTGAHPDLDAVEEHRPDSLT